MHPSAASGLSFLVLAGSIFAALVGSLYAGAHGGHVPQSLRIVRLASVVEAPYGSHHDASPSGVSAAVAASEGPVEAPGVPTASGLGRAASGELAELRDVDEAIVDVATGVVVGPLKIQPSLPGSDVDGPPGPDDQIVTMEVESPVDGPEAESADAEAAQRLAVAASPTRTERAAAEPAPRRTRAAPRATRSTPSRPSPPSPTPRLHPDPGQHVILTARAMMARGEAITGSCYRYISTVFERAGHRGWRDRRVVYRESRDGPYADLGRIRAGDWLYIVNHPHRTPVGTHSVLFVSWADRARGYANVIDHPGGGAASSGRLRTYDVSRTYSITRPTLR